jgi:transcriptional regulator with XRE-family HTH domain
MTHTDPDEPDYLASSEGVRAELRAQMGRLDLTQTQLSSLMGVDARWLSRRITGATPMTTTDLVKIATALGLRCEIRLVRAPTPRS